MARRRGRKSRPEDDELLAELRDALEDQPPKSVVDRWKDAVRAVVSKGKH